jgi:DNA-binding NtrC family response regulator
LLSLSRDESLIDLILLDLNLDDTGLDGGLNLLEKIRSTWETKAIIVMTKDNEGETKKRALENGADYFLEKFNFDREFWPAQFKKAILESQKRSRSQQEEYINPPDYPLIGVSNRSELLRRSLKIAAQTSNATIFLSGETGVGKSIAARFIHANSGKRSNKPFEEVHITNVGGKEMIASQLFGHKKGSFTDAKEDQKGRLEMANGGTLFLDEIAELDLDSQTKLLQFLDRRVIRPLGSSAEIKLDVLLVTATNKDVEKMVEEGTFREDLFYRLNAINIEIPPLRFRRDDIVPLFCHFSKQSEDMFKKRFEPKVWDYLLSECPWRGNIRRLEHSISQFDFELRVRNLDKINWDCVPKDLLKENPDSQEKKVGESKQPYIETKLVQTKPLSSEASELNLSTLERITYNNLKKIEDALEKSDGNKADAALLTNHKTDDNIRYALKKYITEYPQLIEHFPRICDVYYKLIAQVMKKTGNG